MLPRCRRARKLWHTRVSMRLAGRTYSLALQRRTCATRGRRGTLHCRRHRPIHRSPVAAPIGTVFQRCPTRLAQHGSIGRGTAAVRVTAVDRVQGGIYKLRLRAVVFTVFEAISEPLMWLLRLTVTGNTHTSSWCGSRQSGGYVSEKAPQSSLLHGFVFRHVSAVFEKFEL